MYDTGEDPKTIVNKKGLKQINNLDELEKIVVEIIEKNQNVVSQFKSGKTKAVGFLVGQVMAKTQGKANPQIVNELILKKLS